MQTLLCNKREKASFFTDGWWLIPLHFPFSVIQWRGMSVFSLCLLLSWFSVHNFRHGVDNHPPLGIIILVALVLLVLAEFYWIARMSITRIQEDIKAEREHKEADRQERQRIHRTRRAVLMHEEWAQDATTLRQQYGDQVALFRIRRFLEMKQQRAGMAGVSIVLAATLLYVVGWFFPTNGLLILGLFVLLLACIVWVAVLYWRCFRLRKQFLPIIDEIIGREMEASNDQ